MLGFAGCKMIRRIVGIAHVADMESIHPERQANLLFPPQFNQSSFFFSEKSPFLLSELKLAFCLSTFFPSPLKKMGL